jgi:hypothetical protein
MWIKPNVLFGFGAIAPLFHSKIRDCHTPKPRWITVFGEHNQTTTVFTKLRVLAKFTLIDARLPVS